MPYDHLNWVCTGVCTTCSSNTSSELNASSLLTMHGTPVHPFQERLALGALGAAVRLGAPQMEGPQLAGELGSSSSVV